jgi:hypothetical protein
MLGTHDCLTERSQIIKGCASNGQKRLVAERAGSKQASTGVLCCMLRDIDFG